METNLQRKVVLVTGGGQGLGEAICAELGEAGASVLVADRSDRAESVAAAISNRGARAVALRGDVGNEDDVRRFIDEANRRFGGLSP